LGNQQATLDRFLDDQIITIGARDSIDGQSKQKRSLGDIAVYANGKNPKPRKNLDFKKALRDLTPHTQTAKATGDEKVQTTTPEIGRLVKAKVVK
jgi:hypothetical protein